MEKQGEVARAGVNAGVTPTETMQIMMSGEVDFLVVNQPKVQIGMPATEDVYQGSIQGFPTDLYASH